MERKKLAEARYEMGWSQEEASALVGVTQVTYSKWERGITDPYPLHVHKLCSLFGKTAAELDLEKTLAETIQEQTTKSAESLTPREFTLPYVPSQGGVLVPLFSGILETSPEDASSVDWATWFGVKLAQLVTIVDHWQGQAVYCDQLQVLLDLEILGFDVMKPQINDESYVLSRRQALLTIATLPAALRASVQQGMTSASMTEKVLTRSAASITSLWHLLKGSELSLIEQTLSTYLLTLATLAQQPSPYQRTAAKLTSQAYRIYGIIALHRNNLKARENYCWQSLYYSEIAEDVSAIVSAHISLANTFYYSNDPVKAMQIYQKALKPPIIKASNVDEGCEPVVRSHSIPPLQLSRIYAELAVAYAQQKQEQEALEALGVARDLYPDHPENDPSFLYAEFSPASMILEEGLTYLALAQHFPNRAYKENARKGFAQIEGRKSERTVPERVFFEITNHQAATALVLQDLDQMISYLENGIEGARRLSSKRRYQEAINIYEQGLTLWPGEAKLKRLQDLFH